jgi:hypothetical protein
MQKYYAKDIYSIGPGVKPNPKHAAVRLASEADARIAELEQALSDIEANCNGYGDVAGWACKRAAKALRPESSTD